MSTHTTPTDPPSTEVPPEVVTAAAERQLGQLLDLEQSPPPRSFAMLLLLGGIGSIIVGIGLAALAVALQDSAAGLARWMGFSACPFVFAFGPVMLIWSVRTFLRGHEGYYLYAGGLVHLKRRRAQAAAWPEITAITRRRSGTELNNLKSKDGEVVSITRDSVIGYWVQPRSGGKLYFAIGNFFADHIRFATQLEHLATQAGVPISG